MAVYSQELRRVVDHFSQYERKPLTLGEKIEKARPNIFNFDYPFFDESKRKEFETKWIKKFLMVEYGFETFELFQLHLDIWMNEKMPYYNQRFKSELIEFDPLMNTIMDRTKDKNVDGTRTDDIDTTGNKSGSFHTDTKENGEFETNTQNDGTTHNEGTGNLVSDGTNDNIGTDESKGTGTKKGNNTNTDNGSNFARTLDENTPDGRLDITTEDGKGIIRYASKINEVTGKNNNTQDIKVDENTTNDVSKNSTDKTTTHDETNSKTTSDGTSKDVGKANGTNESSGFKDGTTNEDTKGNSKLDQKTNQKGNEKEHYLGKIGVETYSEMLEKYRQTFIRVESEIYEECRKDLFMLVY